MKWIVKLLKYLLILGVIGIFIAGIIVGGTYLHFKSELPSTENLRQVQLQVPLRIYSAEHQLIAEYGEQRRLPVTYDEVPEVMTRAFLAAEDHNFFHHVGVDPTGLARAVVQLAVTGKRSQGGSTITMQLARNFYLSRKRTYTRKIREIFLALHIEQELSKQEILALYLNKIYLGHRAYGIGAAAQVYYDKTIDQLSLAETAMIAGLPKAPSKYNPITNPKRALLRRNYVINRMRALGYIDDTLADSALAAPVTAKPHHAKTELSAPYMAEMARRFMVDKYGADAYISGFHVYTTLSGKLQLAADEGLAVALEAYDKRHGWRGAQKHLDNLPTEAAEMDKLLSEQSSVHSLLPALVTELKDQSAVVYYGQGRIVELTWDGLKWARAYISEDKRKATPKHAEEILQVGDIVHIQEYETKEHGTQWRLAQIPAVSGALVALDPKNGAILALVGGYDYYSSKFNRVIQAKRQPGSGFKPIIYSAALEAGYTAASMINDAPVVTENTGQDDYWRPNNYSGKFYGPTRLRLALTKSRNLVSIRLLRAMGVSHLLEHAKNFGFNPDELPHNLSLALGSGEATPLQMARAYSVLANGGHLIDPFFINRIEKDNGELVYAADPVTVTDCDHCLPEDGDPKTTPKSAPGTISPENRYIMYSMMQDVITLGTATKARVLGRKDLAGKTGTTNEQRDGWFNGFNQSIVASTWVGFDKNHRLGRGETGGKTALPAWIHFMQTALQDIPDKPPEMPSSMVTVRIDKATGARTNSGGKNTMFEIFRADHVPEAAAESAPMPAEANGPGSSAKPKGTAEDLF